MAKVIVAGNRHLSIPNLPRNSKHTLIRPNEFPLGRYPLGKIWRPLGTIAAWQPVFQGYDVVHSFNCIPYTNKPWFVTLEQHLSLYKHITNKFEILLRDRLKHRLALDNCQKIIAISEYAKMRFSKQLEGWELFDRVMNKVEIIHPNFPVKASEYKTYKAGENLQVVFVGHHLARKGGIVALRLAQKAEKLGLPITIHIVSELRYGAGVPTDFPDRAKYAEDLKLINLPNVVYHKQLPNQKVLELLAASHFQILATLHDTYGYSVIEGFSVATPAIATNICAIPEFLHDGENGYLLKLPLTERREWSDWPEESRRETDEYWQILDRTYNNLADQALQLAANFLERGDRIEHYERLSAGALEQAKNVHDSQKLNQLFDDLYATASTAVSGKKPN